MTPVVRKMNLSDLELALEWAQVEGWGPGKGDAAAFFAADPDGFWALELDGEMIASLSAVGYPGGVHFMGFYIVRPDHRKTGLGLQLWTQVWQQLDGLVLGGDAVLEQLANYERYGFVAAYRNIRFVGLPPASEPASCELVKATEVELSAVADYDASNFFGRRSDFLRQWIAHVDRRSLVAINAAGAIVGFGVIRPSDGIDRVGPLFADSQEIARELLIGLGEGSTREIGIDVPLPNSAAVDLVKSLGFAPGFETARIYRGEDPRLPLDRIFGVTSLELG
ncbi:MAG: GNAT family N-acetyltransferase [Solirubrobacterales bacterium]|nr:GNAT family N-acetyltransferase [Solirubrobacterales bacterium]